MASPVDTSVKFHFSNWSAAPVLSGTAGALTGLLDALLIDGYDTKTLTGITVSGGVATATFTGGHSSVVDSVVRIAGATGPWTDLNGDQKVTTRTPTSVSFATALGNGTATGSLTLRMAPCGWQKVFSGTNKAAYRSTDVLSTGMLLRVDDGSTEWARVTGYESMTSVDAGVGGFPSLAQQPDGDGFWHKSTQSGTSPIDWAFAGDSRVFYLAIRSTQLQSPTTYFSMGVRGFGDMIPLRPGGDAYACALPYAASNTVIQNAHRFDFSLSSGTVSNVGVDTGGAIALPRSHTGVGASILTIASALHINGTSNDVQSGATVGQRGFGPFPSSVTGQLLLSQMYIAAGSSTPTPRALVPGLFFIPQDGVAAVLQPGNVEVLSNGRKVMIFPAANTGAQNSTTSTTRPLCAVDITGPWR